MTTPAGVPVATGTVTFVVYGPGDTTCTGAPVFTSADAPVDGRDGDDGDGASASFTPPAPGRTA